MKCAHCGAEVNAEDRTCSQCNREIISDKYFFLKTISVKITIAILIILFFAILFFFINKTIKNSIRGKISFNNSSVTVQLDEHITFNLPPGWTAACEGGNKNRISATRVGNVTGINKFELAFFPPASIGVKASDIRIGDETIMEKVYQNELAYAENAKTGDESKRLKEFKADSFGFVKLNKKDWAQLVLRREKNEKTSAWWLYYIYDGSNIIVMSYEYEMQSNPAKQKLIAAGEDMIKGVMKQAGNMK